ncbi:MAG TPA: alkaline phosphatase family protein [Actinocrinis sp.]|nr:alkaline phosphatase family protein [Actinocrinis sp.]
MSTAFRTRRVLVVGVDGVRLDTLARVRTPHLDSVAARGFLAPVRVEPDAPSLSGPCWTTVATGVTAAKHGVLGNVFTNHRLAAFPDFASILHRIGMRSYVAAGWEPLVTPQYGGPLFATPSRTTFISEAGHDAPAWEVVDEQITVDAEHVLTTDRPIVSFVYLGSPDVTAHFLGCGKEYDAAIEAADVRLGRILASVGLADDAQGDAGDEWTVIIVTDHGHVDAGGHGGDTDVERTAWIAAFGPGIEPGAVPGGGSAEAPARALRHVDVAPSVYTALRLPLGREAAFDGTPFNEA